MNSTTMNRARRVTELSLDQRRADAGSAGEVRDRVGSALQGPIVIAASKLVGDPGQPRAERERPDPPAGSDRH